MVHHLKIEQKHLSDLLSLKKRAEIRFNDRDYQVNDSLYFNDKERGGDGQMKHCFKIIHIHSGLGLLTGYVVLSVAYQGLVIEPSGEGFKNEDMRQQVVNS